MKYLKVSFPIILGILLIVSCAKESETTSIQKESNCIGLTKLELATVGTLHNEYVTKVYRNVDFNSCTDCTNEILQAFLNLDTGIPEIEENKEELLSKSNDIYQEIEAIQFDIRNWKDHPFSQESFIHLTSLMEEIDEMDNFTDFISNMNNLQNEVNADKNLSCFDLELLTGTIEVAKNSSYLWISRENGGLDFQSISQEGQATIRWSWRKAARADATASAAYFVGLGAANLLLAAPGSNAVILGGWGIAAGFSSAVGGL